MTREEYGKIWSTFKSEFFDSKFRVFNEKRTEFCYAGDWTLWLDMGTGKLHQCYCSLFCQDMFEDVTKPLVFKAIGHHCQQPHCYNAHAFLTFGAIPEHESPTYATIRNRVCVDGTEWLQPRMKAFMSQKLKDNNTPYSVEKMNAIDAEMKSLEKRKKRNYLLKRIKSKIKLIIGKFTK